MEGLIFSISFCFMTGVTEKVAICEIVTSGLGLFLCTVDRYCYLQQWDCFSCLHRGSLCWPSSVSFFLLIVKHSLLMRLSKLASHVVFFSSRFSFSWWEVDSALPLLSLYVGCFIYACSFADAQGVFLSLDSIKMDGKRWCTWAPVNILKVS